MNWPWRVMGIEAQGEIGKKSNVSKGIIFTSALYNDSVQNSS